MSTQRIDHVKIACLQVCLRPEESRFERITRVLELVLHGPPADLVVLPELWDVGYFAFDDYAAASCTLESGTALALASVATQRHVVLVGGSVVERDGGKLYNTVVVFGSDGRVIGSYRKSHLFGYRSRETELLSPGTGPVVISTPHFALGLATCFDLRFPDHFANLRDWGADLIVVPAAWPAARVTHWDVLTRARAIETQTPLIAANSGGVSCDIELAGHSCIINARGELMAHADKSADVWCSGTIRLSETSSWRKEFPLRDEVVVK